MVSVEAKSHQKLANKSGNELHYANDKKNAVQAGLL